MIDPDDLLTEVRTMYKAAIKHGNIDAMQLAHKVKELDEWLTKRGFPPKDWSAWT